MFYPLNASSKNAPRLNNAVIGECISLWLQARMIRYIKQLKVISEEEGEIVIASI